MSEPPDYSYVFEPEVGRVRLTVRGALDDRTLASAFREIYTDPGYVPGMNELTDCRAVTQFEMTPAGVRDLLAVVEELQTADAPYRVAIVAPGDAVFGMARMYELLQSQDVEQVEVFRSIERAERYTRSGDA